MDGAHWTVLTSLFPQLLEVPPEERRCLLAGFEVDEDLRQELAKLLEAHEREERLPAEQLLAQGEGPPIRLPTRPFIGGYRLLSLLGEGGMGEVWLAEREDPEFPHRVAIKRIRSGLISEELRQRFAIERKALARLSHRGIALLLDGGIDQEGIPYLVIEHVEGEPLTREADRRRLAPEARVELFLAVCEPVSYAHANLVVHRDLKPSNILLTDAGEIRLLDFGIAKLLDPDLQGEVGVTRTAHRLATPEYASPEQLRGGQITTATDVYALGLLLFELLTGQRPHGQYETSLADLERAVCSQDAPRASEVLLRGEASLLEEAALARQMGAGGLGRFLRGDLDTILATAISRDPARRYPSVERLAEDLRRFQQGKPIWARPDSALYQVGKFVGRHRGGVAAIATIAVLLVGFAGYALRQSTLVAAERDKARLERDTAREVSDFVTELFSADPFADDEGFLDTTTLGEFLERSEGTLRRELADRPVLRAALLSRLGRFHGNLGHLEQAGALAAESLELRRSLPGDLREDVAESLNTLATVRQEQGEWQEAEEFFRESLKLREEVHGPNHGEVAESLNNLAVLMVVRNEPSRYSNLEAVIRRAVRLREELFGSDHLDTAQSLNTLATFLLRRRHGEDQKEAEEIFRRILETRRRKLGPDHALVGTVENNLANLLDDLGREEEAIVLFQDAIRVLKLSLGPDHSRVAGSLFGLSEALWDSGDLVAAEEALRASLEIDEKELPDGHPFLAASWLRLGELLLARELPHLAEPQLRRAVAAMRGREVAELARAESALGEALFRQDLWSEARPLLESARAQMEVADSPNEEALSRTVTLLSALNQASAAGRGLTGDAP
ncbi:MAG: serine/threonine-protein kinase [Deltaproteobacteria bacterium]|nr:serine/threonine-protein kinase [Deltaproteobacteria bacterium]